MAQISSMLTKSPGNTLSYVGRGPTVGSPSERNEHVMSRSTQRSLRRAAGAIVAVAAGLSLTPAGAAAAVSGPGVSGPVVSTPVVTRAALDPVLVAGRGAEVA